MIAGEGIMTVFGAMGQSISEALNTGSAALDSFLGTLVQTVLKSIAANLAASMGFAVESASKTASGSGPLAAFVLPSLIAGATAAVGGAFKKIPKFAKGGIVSTPTLGLFGEYPGASRNPEVVAPLDKLQGMMANTGGNKVQVGGSFTLRGQDLVVALERANTTRDRII